MPEGSPGNEASTLKYKIPNVDEYLWLQSVLGSLTKWFIL